MTYLHGYSQTEEQRLVSQAEFWRDRIIRPGTSLPPGTRLLEIGCGVGAVLQVLDSEFRDLTLSGVDIEPIQIASAERRLGTHVDLLVADGRDLPFAGGSFDHVWIQFVLEHVDAEGARRILREAHRVLVPDGRLTVIEADYHSLRLHPEFDGLADDLIQAMDAHGQSDAGPRLREWLKEGGWNDVDPGPRHFSYQGAATPPPAGYLADALAATVPDAPAILGLRRMGDLPTDSISFTVHKATASA
jgi:ubiquinone/menaquinone biosynthesis C-methylase UbiE